MEPICASNGEPIAAAGALAMYDPDGLLFLSVNTPHDYERAQGLVEMKVKRTQDRITE